MGIMGFLRERMGKILAISIGIALFAFIVGEVGKSGSSFFRDDRNMLGEVAGQKVEYDKFNKLYEQQSNQFRQQSQQANLTPQFVAYIQESTWNSMVSQLILKKEVDKLGLAVGDDEVNNMVNGNNPDPQIIQAFGNPQTGKIDITRFNNFKAQLNASKANDPIRQQWNDFIEALGTNKLSQKYLSIVSNGLYVNSLEAKENYQAKNKLANFKYVTLDYASVPDNKVTLTDADYQAYYDEHKNEFKTPQELRTFDYISFNAAPSKEDTAAIKQQAEKLATEFKASTNDSLFVQINSEDKAPLKFVHKGQLEPKLDSVMFTAAKGFTYGPYLSGNTYKIAKLVDDVVGPDSIKARHILIDPSGIGLEKAKAKADSIKKLIQGGKSFAELSTQFSTDKAAAAKGGDLGTFARGLMVPEFDDQIFTAKKGDLKVITTQFGVHIVDIEDEKGSSKVVKVAIVDVPLKASSATQTAAYSKAQAFLANLTKENFDAEAKKEKLQIKTATDVNGVAGAIPGVENARDIVKWAYTAEPGDFSEKVFITGDQYIVAHLMNVKPKGQLSLDAVKKQIEPMVKNAVKGKQLTEKLQAALNGASNIDQVAQKSGAKVVPVQNIVFANPIIPGGGAEYKVIGTVFGSQPNKLSKVIEGQQGVFVFSVDSFINPAPLTNTVKDKETLAQGLLQRSQSAVFDALKDKANVKDYRAKFL